MQIDLEAYAKITADLAEGDRPMREVLESYGIAEPAWNDASLHWNVAMAEAARTDPSMAIRFSELFAAAQDAKKPIAPLDVAGYAALVNDVEAIGLARALAQRQLSNADYFRLIRYWAKAIAGDPEVSRRYNDLR